MVELGVEKELVVVSEIRFEGGLRNLLASFNGQERSGPISVVVASAMFDHENKPPRAHRAVCTPVARVHVVTTNASCYPLRMVLLNTSMDGITCPSAPTSVAMEDFLSVEEDKDGMIKSNLNLRKKPISDFTTNYDMEIKESVIKLNKWYEVFRTNQNEGGKQTAIDEEEVPNEMGGYAYGSIKARLLSSIVSEACLTSLSSLLRNPNVMEEVLGKIRRKTIYGTTEQIGIANNKRGKY
ncbi:hypothetical protein LXL04_006753 [Taraxacum kok-saghyz]